MKMPPLPPRPVIDTLLKSVLSVPSPRFEKRWDQAIKNNTAYYNFLQRMTKEELIQHHMKSCVHSLMTGKPGFQRLRTSHIPVRVLAGKIGVDSRRKKRDDRRMMFIYFRAEYLEKHPGAPTTKVVQAFTKRYPNVPKKIDTYYGYLKKNTR